MKRVFAWFAWLVLQQGNKVWLGKAGGSLVEVNLIINEHLIDLRPKRVAMANRYIHLYVKLLRNFFFSHNDTICQAPRNGFNYHRGRAHFSESPNPAQYPS